MAVPMDSFPDRAYFFGNALAGLILHSRNYLKASETKRFKSKPAAELYCGSRNTFPFLTRPNPIAEVGEVVLLIDLIDSTATKKGIAFRIKNNEIIFNTIRSHL